MSGLTSLTAIAQWVYAALTGDATLTALLGSATAVYQRDNVPSDAPTPYLMFEVQEPEFVNAVGGFRIVTDTELVVRAVGPAARRGEVSFDSLNTILARVDTLLHRATISSNDYGTMLGCTAERPLPGTTTPQDGGGLTPEAGMVYRIMAQDA